jgi:hypothetical protein
VYLTDYYDPRPQSANQLCTFDHASFSGGGIGDRFVRRTAERVLQQRLDAWQARIFTQVSTQLAQLNELIGTVGEQHHAHVVPLDFTGHDLCQTIDPWVFPPDLHANVRFRWAGPDYAENVTITSPLRCTAPCGPTTNFTTKYNAEVGTLAVTGVLFPNGTPHPDDAGQQAIARAFQTTA